MDDMSNFVPLKPRDKYGWVLTGKVPQIKNDGKDRRKMEGTQKDG